MSEEELVLQMREVLSEGFDVKAAELANAVLALYRSRESYRIRFEELSNEKTDLHNRRFNATGDLRLYSNTSQRK